MTVTDAVVIDGLPYPIILAADAAAALPRLLAPDCPSLVIVHDRRVARRAQALQRALTASGVAVLGSFSLAGGERAKRAHVVAKLYDAFLACGADRSTWVVAVGGGTITDVAGFVSATYLRGVRWVAVPTTVLGMADAAIGGKTGIDLTQGKNLVGAFWDPSAVVADLASLATLPARERSTGLAEAVKCAVIGDPALLHAVESLPLRAKPQMWMPVIAAAARVKAKIVAEDPRERGRRAVLNLGHTVGHAIETASGYAMPHGAAVSIGLRAAGLLAQRQGWWPASDHARVVAALQRVGLPVHAEGISRDAIMEGMARDKKSVDGRIRFVLPVALGDVRTGIHIERAVVRDVVAACLAAPAAAERSA